LADKRCDNGHFIDESWDLCPYCPSEVPEPDLASLRSRGSTADVVIRPATQARPSTLPQTRPMPVVAPTSAGRNETPPPLERTVAIQKIAPAAGEAKRYVVGWLIGLSGKTRGESFSIRIGRNILGRDRRSDIVINDDQASSHHADLVFRPEERRFILMDHNSTNGTYVNETEIEPRRDLAMKDVVRIGSHKFLFVPLCGEGFYWDDEGALQ
jgi:hypothetical protein